MAPPLYWKILLGDLKNVEVPNETMSQTSSNDLDLAGIKEVNEE